jgi:hypothetical protein
LRHKVTAFRRQKNVKGFGVSVKDIEIGKSVNSRDSSARTELPENPLGAGPKYKAGKPNPFDNSSGKIFPSKILGGVNDWRSTEVRGNFVREAPQLVREGRPVSGMPPIVSGNLKIYRRSHRGRVRQNMRCEVLCLEDSIGSKSVKMISPTLSPAARAPSQLRAKVGST